MTNITNMANMTKIDKHDKHDKCDKCYKCDKCNKYDKCANVTKMTYVTNMTNVRNMQSAQIFSLVKNTFSISKYFPPFPSLFLFSSRKKDIPLFRIFSSFFFSSGIERQRQRSSLRFAFLLPID